MESYDWEVDRNKVAANQVEIKNEELEFRLERRAFRDVSAVDLAYIKTTKPFSLTPKDIAHESSQRAISFLTVITGRVVCKMPSGDRYIIDKDWGVFTDFVDGSLTLTCDAGMSIRSFGGALPVDRVLELFEDTQPGEVKEELIQQVKEGGLVSSFRVTPAIRAIAEAAINSPMQSVSREMFLEGASLQIFAHIVHQKLHEPVLGSVEETQALAKMSTLVDAVEWLESDLKNPPTVKQLAIKTGLSPRSLNQGFKKLFNFTVTEWLNKKRMEAARVGILEAPELPLKVIADNVGYKHLSNFIIAFKREFGITPKQLKSDLASTKL